MKDRIFITPADMNRLRRLIALRSGPEAAERETLDQLEEELDRAELVTPEALPKGVIAMHSLVRLKDLDSGEVVEYRLVFPGDKSTGEQCVSVLAPIGTALIGYQAGDTIEWRVPKGIRRLKVLSVKSGHSRVEAMANVGT